MDIKIRQEVPEDYKAVFELTVEAFKDLEVSDHTEQFLVERMRKSEAFIPELSLVAVFAGKVIGHIMLSKVSIVNNSNNLTSLVLGPVSVLPEYQKKGIGSSLIQRSHELACTLGYHSVVLIGHPNYYPRFGYKRAAEFGLTFPFEAPDEACMAVELIPDSLQNAVGRIVFPVEFY